MMHMLEKPGPCSQYENYQRQEGYPVGKQRTLNKGNVCLYFSDCMQAIIILNKETFVIPQTAHNMSQHDSGLK
jgi:hypothetical protein